jgi:Gpi18-like mannosyltransferase
LGLITGWFVWKLAGRLKLENAWFAVVVAVFTPIYFALMSSGMTEIVFSLMLVLSVYLFFSEKYAASAIFISFLFLARTEGLAFELLFLIALIIRKQYRAIPWLATGFLVFSLIGLVFHYHDFWWLYNQRPYSTGNQFVLFSGKDS